MHSHPLAALTMAVILGVSAQPARAEERNTDAVALAAARIDVPIEEPLDAPRVDPFAGRTVRDRNDGMGIIMARASNVPKVGQPAPLFELKTADGKETIRLADYRGKRPVVLIFGSFS
jgi:hypothetical protein